MRMKPDWLNDSSVTQVVVVAEGSYIRHIVVLPPIEPRRVARTNHDTTAVSGEKNESRIRQSVALIVITKLNGDFLSRDAYENMGYV